MSSLSDNRRIAFKKRVWEGGSTTDGCSTAGPAGHRGLGSRHLGGAGQRQRHTAALRPSGVVDGGGGEMSPRAAWSPLPATRQQAAHTTSTRCARIWVVQDDGLVGDALGEGLKDEGYEVRVDVDARGVREVVEQFCPDLAILDVHLPSGPDGCSAARALRAASDVAVVFLSEAHSLEDRLAGFDAGADDYLAKPFSMAELSVRVQALLGRTGHAGSSLRHVGDLTIDGVAHRVSRAGTTLELTKTEFDLLSALARHPNKAMAKGPLLAEVWHGDATDPNLVEAHVCSLRRKLEAHGPRIVHTAWGFGYRLQA
ncbi:MAG TPA: response regulator transcription factor [Acidimicrobiales bacterium]|nr:response regulator transcription factor [Acidimicrobiales bacterium]